VSNRLFALVLTGALAGWGSPSSAQGLGVERQNLELNFEYVSMDVQGLAGIVHEYKSRNRYVNSLGAGWCNALHLPRQKAHVHVVIETRLSFFSDRIQLEDCGSPEQFAPAEVFMLPADLAGNDNLSKNWPTEKHPIDLTSNDSLTRLRNRATITGNGISIQNRLNGVTRHYDKRGMLTAIDDMRVTLTNEGRVEKIQLGDRWVQYQYKADKLQSVASDKGHAAKFSYRNDGTVSEIENAWLKKITFSFSSQFNLESIEYSNNKNYTIFYDEDKDIVRGLLLPDGCMQEFAPILSDDKNSYKVQTVVTCDGVKKKSEAESFNFSEEINFEALFGETKSSAGEKGSLYKK